jgi:hypothetical protein
MCVSLKMSGKPVSFVARGSIRSPTFRIRRFVSMQNASNSWLRSVKPNHRFRSLAQTSFTTFDCLARTTKLVNDLSRLAINTISVRHTSHRRSKQRFSSSQCISERFRMHWTDFLKSAWAALSARLTICRLCSRQCLVLTGTSHRRQRQLLLPGAPAPS